MGTLKDWNVGSTLRVAALVIVALTALACAAATPVKAPPASTTTFPPVEMPPYKLQVGDQIAVLFWGNPELDQELVIRPDGAISLPFIDEVAAAGLTPTELDAELSELYAAELATPEITVIVRGVGGQEIFVGGEVANQGSFQLRGAITLYQAIQQAGGFLDTARRSDVVVIRTTSTGERIAAKVDAMPIVSGRDPGVDLQLQAADIIFVPRARILSFTTFLKRYFYDVFPIRIVGTIELFDETNPALQ